MTAIHTQEPWDFVYEHGSWEGYHEPNSGDFQITFRTESKANAERIVACVNAMTDIEDPKQFVDNSLANATRLMKVCSERDELLEAIESIIDGTAFDKETGLIWSHRLESLRELVSKVKGE